jgi:hypothetical protein
MSQKPSTIGTFPRFVRVREVLSNVPQCSCAQQSIDDGVNENVCVGMPVETHLALDSHASYD